jgi:hypothetical protein
VVLVDAISHNDYQKGFIGSLANFAIYLFITLGNFGKVYQKFIHWVERGGKSLATIIYCPPLPPIDELAIKVVNILTLLGMVLNVIKT